MADIDYDPITRRPEKVHSFPDAPLEPGHRRITVANNLLPEGFKENPHAFQVRKGDNPSIVAVIYHEVDATRQAELLARSKEIYQEAQCYLMAWWRSEHHSSADKAKSVMATDATQHWILHCRMVLDHFIQSLTLSGEAKERLVAHFALHLNKQWVATWYGVMMHPGNEHLLTAWNGTWSLQEGTPLYCDLAYDTGATRGIDGAYNTVNVVVPVNFIF